jgi:hypothetical protein
MNNERQKPKYHYLSLIAQGVGITLLSTFLVTPALGADTLITPVTLVQPTNIPDVAPLPFTGKTVPAFSIPATISNLSVSPNQGVVGDAFVVSGSSLPANSVISLTWGTSTGTWVTDIEPSSVNYLGISFTKMTLGMSMVTTDSDGAFSFSTMVPPDFGGIHDIYAVVDGVAVAHGGYQINRTLTVSPVSGPIGTPITVTYTGMGASLYTAGGAVHWDNAMAGEEQAIWTRGVGKVVIYAAGPIGIHYVNVGNAIGFTYLNVIQSPIPFTNGGSIPFTVIRDIGISAPTETFPPQVTATSNLHTTLTTVGLDPTTQATMTLSQKDGPILTKVKVSTSAIPVDGTYQMVWSTVVGNRVNCPTSTCWAFSSIPLSTVVVKNGTSTTDITIPDNLGGWHVIQLMKGNTIESQAPFYVKESIMPFYDKNGNQTGMGIAKFDPSTAPEVIARGQAGLPATSFKAGEDFTISIKGVGWTQLDNTLAVTYDNSYIGYGCGFNSNGYMVVRLKATGAPGTHIIDLHPLLYTNQPSFANTPYGMLPVLTSDRDFPGLALGYQVPAFHFEITIKR